MTAEAERHELQEVPASLRGIYRRAMSGKSRVSSIKCMCLECQGWTDGAKAAVRDCQASACPLWSVRPYQAKPNQEAGS